MKNPIKCKKEDCLYSNDNDYINHCISCQFNNIKTENNYFNKEELNK